MTVEPYDREVILIEKVMQKLQARTALPLDQEAFRREIIARFEEIGFIVDVRWWTTNEEGVYIPDIDLVDRCSPLPYGFDHEFHQHEVLTDSLGIEGHKGDQKIKFNPEQLHEGG